MKLTLKQAAATIKGQNPTTRAQAGFGMHTVKDGDTLPSISYRAYGDATRWRLIAEANGVDNPLHLRRGSSLSLPALETDAGGERRTTRRGHRRPRRRREARPVWRDATIEVKVVDSLTLPDMALVRLVDPQGDNIDSHPMQLGKDLEIKVGAAGDRATTRIFKGQIAAVEPEFTAKGCIISIRAYDKAHKLNRERKTRTFQQVSASDMVKKLASEAGLSPKVTSTSVVHEFFQQSNETDWDFAWRLALMHDYEVVVDDTSLEFRPANTAAGAAVELKWQEALISFRPRMSGVQRPKTVNVRAWNPKAKKA